MPDSTKRILTDETGQDIVSALEALTNVVDPNGTAVAAALKLNNMTTSITLLSAGATPTSSLTEVDGHFHLTLGIPLQLPTVTASNNGEILKVENGAWTVGEAPTGGGTGLPAVTSSDNGKILQVSDGAWAIEDNISMGRKANTTIGTHSFAVGNDVEASSNNAHAEGNSTRAAYVDSHAEGWGSEAVSQAAHAEGRQGRATAFAAHAEGCQTVASGYASHSQGMGTQAKNKSQHVAGEYNVLDPSTNAAGIRGNYVEIIGNGADANNRSNARTLDWNGNQWVAGNLTAAGGSITIGATTLTEVQLQSLLSNANL